MLKRIYTLRATCNECNLDKMEVFHTIPNARPKSFAAQLKPHIQEAFEKRYGCTHKVKFALEVDDKYKWDTKKLEAVEI